MGKAHSNAYKRIGMFFDPTMDICMKAICGREENWVKESAEKFGWAGYETNWEKLIARSDIDIIDITAPSNVHKEIVIKAAEAGKHILYEKPLSLNLKDAREMLEAAEKNNVKHQIGFNYRFAPEVLLAKKIIEEGKLGKIYHYRAMYLQDWIIDPEFPLVWRLDKNVASLRAHVIDLARFLVGDIDKVIGMSKTFDY